MKPNLLSITAVILAITFSAFSNVKLKTTKRYYHFGNAFIETQPPGLTCQADDVCCELIFTGTNLPSFSSFEENQIPLSEDYTVTRILDEASYQD